MKLKFIFSCLVVYFLFFSLALAQKPAESYPPVSFSNHQSRLQVPLKVSTQTLENQVNTQLNGLLYESKGVEGLEEAQVKIYKRDSIQLKGDKSALLAEIPLKIVIRGDYVTSVLGFEVRKNIDQDLRFLARVRSEFSLNKDWKLQTKTQLVNYEWIDKPTINLGILKLSVDKIVDNIIAQQKDKFIQQADNMVTKYIDIRTPVAEAWKQLQTPMQVADWTGDKIWIDNQPSKLEITPILFERDTLKTTALVDVQAKGYLQKKSNTVVFQILPDCKIVNAADNSFNLQIAATVSKDLAIRKAKEIFMKKKYDFRNGKYQIEIQDLNLYGSNGRMVIQLEMKGSVQGTVYLIGKPTFNKRSQSIEIEDFDYVMDAEVEISKVVRWLFAAKIKNEIRKTMEKEINTQVLNIKKEIEKNLKAYPLNPNTLLQGKLADFEVNQIYLTPQEMKANIFVSGQMEVLMTGF